MTQEHGYFEKLYEEHRRYVLLLLRKSIREDHIQQELSQDVWLAVGHLLHTFDRQTAFRTWLFVVVQNVVRQHRRLMKRRPLDFFPDPDIHPAPEGLLELRSELQDILKVVEPEEERRRTYILHDLCEHTHAEVAALTNTSEATARWRVGRTRAVLEEYGKNFRAAAVVLGFGSPDEAWKRVQALWDPQGSPIPTPVPRWSWKFVTTTLAGAGAGVGAVVAVVVLLLSPPSGSRSLPLVVAETDAQTKAASVPLSSTGPLHDFSTGWTEQVPLLPVQSLPARTRDAFSNPVRNRERIEDSRLALLLVRKALNVGAYERAQRLLATHVVRFGTFEASARNELQAEARRNQPR